MDRNKAGSVLRFGSRRHLEVQLHLTRVGFGLELIAHAMHQGRLKATRSRLRRQFAPLARGQGEQMGDHGL